MDISVLKVADHPFDRDAEIVLGKTSRGEYGTWVRRKDEPNNLFWGHYYGTASFKKATKEFNERKKVK